MTANLHRGIALGLLLAVIVGAYWLVDRVWLGQYVYYQENIEQLQDRFLRYVKIIAGRPELEAKLRQVGQDNSIAQYYLAQPSPTLAATDLQQQVKNIIESNGGRLASTQILPATKENGFTRVAIKVQMLVNEMEALQKTLYALESAKPLLFINNVQMRARTVRKRVPRTNNRRATNRRNSRDRRRRQPLPVKTETQLTAQFELAGYISKGEA